MRYIGGKSRIANDIAAIVTKAQGSIYLEPFLGGGATFAKVASYYPRTFASDLNAYLMFMWMGFNAGWVPPDSISEEQYQWLKYEDYDKFPDEKLPLALRGLAGIACSFGGKWFGGYARGKTDKGTDRDWLNETVRNIQKILPAMENTIFCFGDYRMWHPKNDWVVYCDPPYRGTQGYNSADLFEATKPFDHDIFWSTMNKWVKAGAKVFVSEYVAPPDWSCAGEFKARQSLTMPCQGREERVERLWTKGGQ